MVYVNWKEYLVIAWWLQLQEGWYNCFLPQVIWRLDNAAHQIDHYPVNRVVYFLTLVCWIVIYRLDSITQAFKNGGLVFYDTWTSTQVQTLPWLSQPDLHLVPVLQVSHIAWAEEKKKRKCVCPIDHEFRYNIKVVKLAVDPRGDSWRQSPSLDTDELKMALRARKVSGAFEKRVPGRSSKYN